MGWLTQSGIEARSSYTQLRVGDVPELLFVSFQRRLDVVLDDLFHYLGTPPDERRRIGERGQVGEHGLEEGRVLDALEKVVGFAFLLDYSAGLV